MRKSLDEVLALIKDMPLVLPNDVTGDDDPRVVVALRNKEFLVSNLRHGWDK